MSTDLTPSMAATLCFINEKPGKCLVAAVGVDYAQKLADMGYITIKGGKCHPTAKAAPFKGRSLAEQRESRMHARATLIARWGSL